MGTNVVSTKTTTWKLDPTHSSAEFKVKHMMISNVTGSFKTLTGTLTEDPADPGLSHIEATIEIGSIDTADAQRDAHLKSADFFDQEKYPTMTFKSSQVLVKGEGEFSVTGDLTMHGVTKQVTFAVEGPGAPAKDPWGKTRIGLSASTRINRKEFGLNWNAALEAGGILVGEDVQIILEAEFIKE